MREETSEDRSPLNWIALRDLTIVVAVMVGVKQSLLPVSQLYAGPVSTLSAMIVATLLLWRRGSGWKDLGFRWPESWLRTAGLTVLTMVVFVICTQLMGLVADRYFEDVSTGTRFAHIEGNLEGYLIIMVLVWTHGSFFEELLFRAFLITNASRFSFF